VGYTITKNVGKGQENKSADVTVVQTLLNKTGDYNLQVNGVCDDAMVAAIVSFQSGFMSKPDGWMSPGGTTFQNLVKVATLGFKLLPQACGYGYYSYSEFARQYGTPDAIKMLQDVSINFYSNTGREVGIGDISFRNGAYMSPHQTHRSGKNIDIRPVRKDGLASPVTIDSADYSSSDTALLVSELLAHSNVSGILFNDRTIKGVSYHQGHHNHLHVMAKT
jgi:penicillin-insensitive murein DD-endopeptidase